MYEYGITEEMNDGTVSVLDLCVGSSPSNLNVNVSDDTSTYSESSVTIVLGVS
jgi:hypothetical protein